MRTGQNGGREVLIATAPNKKNGGEEKGTVEQLEKKKYAVNRDE